MHIEVNPFTVKTARETTDFGAFGSKIEKNDQKPRVSPCLSYQDGDESALALSKTVFGPSKRPISGLAAKGRFLKAYEGRGEVPVFAAWGCSISYRCRRAVQGAPADRTKPWLAPLAR